MPIVGALPFTLQNGTVADATQVMADFNSIKTDVNGNAAANGANNDITSLAGLTTPLSVAQGGTAFTTTEQVFVRGYLWGLALSNDSGGTTALAVAAGACRDSTNVDIMIRASALTGKVLASAWTVGNGGGMLDTGSIANTTYHIYLIKRVDTGVVDAIASTSASAPTLPTNYTLYRRIGSVLRESGAVVLFTQWGDYFARTTVLLDITANNPGTSAVTRTLLVPTGIIVEAVVNLLLFNTGVLPTDVYLSALDQADQAPASAIGIVAPLTQTDAAVSSNLAGTKISVITNVSAQIRSRVSGSDGNVYLYIASIGWRDLLGRFGP